MRKEMKAKDKAKKSSSSPSLASSPASTSGKESGKKETKKSRAKSLVEPTLEAVTENQEEINEDETQALNPCLPPSSGPRKPEACPRFFGVRSYLHQFYDTTALRDPQKYEEFDDYRQMIAPKRRGWTLLLWRIDFWAGFCLLIVGALMLFVGYAVPHKEVIIGHEEEIAIIDQKAIDFNKKLYLSKVLGLGVFCVGGALTSAALLLPSLVGVSCLEDCERPQDRSTYFPFNLKMVNEEDEDIESNPKIPVIESVEDVQPKREDEAVMTSTGLTSVK